MNEHDIQNEIRLKLSELGYYTERINVGAGYLIPKQLMDRLKRSLTGELKQSSTKYRTSPPEQSEDAVTCQR